MSESRVIYQSWVTPEGYRAPREFRVLLDHGRYRVEYRMRLGRKAWGYYPPWDVYVVGALVSKLLLAEETGARP